MEAALKPVSNADPSGNCLQCGQEIPEKRLEVEPWARHCIRCQEYEEQGLLEERSRSFGIPGEDDDEESPAADAEDESEDERETG